MGGKITPSLRRKLEENPQLRMRLILRVKGRPEDHEPLLSQRGLSVRRRLSLLGALAIEGEAEKALTLLGEKWVLSLEEDREIRALR